MADSGRAQENVTALANYARSLRMSPAQLRAAASQLNDERPEPSLRSLVAGALEHDEQLRDYYARQMRLLVDGLPSYTDADDRLVPAFPGFGDHGPSEVEPSRLQDLLYAVGRESAARKLRTAATYGHHSQSYDPDAHGRGAEENFKLAVRKLFRRSEVRRWLLEDPTAELKLKQGGADFAHHLTVGQFADWLEVACTTGDDPELDRLLLLCFRHTGLRQEALINLTLDAIDVEECLLRASAKYGYTQPLPVNRQLLQEIDSLAQARGSRDGSDPAFRYRDGSPLTGRRFDTLSDRLKARYAWAAPLTIGPHAIRRLVEDQVASRFGLPELTIWAGHSWKALPVSYKHYVKKPDVARLREVAEDLFGPLDAPLPPGPSPTGVFGAPYGIPPVRRVRTGTPAIDSVRVTPDDGAPTDTDNRRGSESVERAPGAPSGDTPLFSHDLPVDLPPGGDGKSVAAPDRPLFSDGEEL